MIMADKTETILIDLINAVLISCNPPDSCMNPNALKAYMA